MRWIVALVLMVAHLVSSGAAESVPVELSKTVPLPGVEGRIDHLAVDLKTGRVFIAALGNNTIEVVDYRKGERVKTLKGFEEPQGIAVLPEARRFVVANGGSGGVHVYDSDSYELVKKIDLSGDADNVRYDAAAERVFVGYASGALAVIDAKTWGVAADVKLSGHPEAFQLEKNGPRIFVNVPKSKQIEVIDRQKNAVVAKWPVKGAHSNFPMVLDEANQRVLVGCRAPARVVVIDTRSGAETNVFECVGDVDDMFLDAETKRLYVIGGEGHLNVFAQVDADHFKFEADIKTSPGARTGLFVPEIATLFVVAPHKGNPNAELRIFKTR